MLHRRSYCSASVIEEKLLVVGGLNWAENKSYRDVDVYCRKENKWSPGPKLNIKKSELACIDWDSKEI